MKKILLSNPPAYLHNHQRHFIQAGSRWSFSFDAPKNSHPQHYQPYPFSLAYATAILEEEGCEVEAFDACALDMDEAEFLSEVELREPDLLVVEAPTVSFPLTMKLLDDVEREVGCEIIVTGPHVTALPNSTSHKALRGEWESLLSERRLLRFEDYPPPDRDCFPNYTYSNFDFHRPCVQMLTSRGCPMACSFCVERHVLYNSPIVRCRSPKAVVDEMEELKSRGAKQIHFDDMDFTARRDIESLCRQIIGRGVDLPWTCLGNILADEFTVRLMAEAGCVGLAFGVETINPHALATVGKGFITRKRVEDFVRLLKNLGIHSSATYTLGLPTETRGSTLATIRFATEELESDSLQFSIATPFPATPFYNMAKRKDWLITEDWTRYDGARYCVVDYPQLKHGEVEELFKFAMELREEKGLKFRH